MNFGLSNKGTKDNQISYRVDSKSRRERNYFESPLHRKTFFRAKRKEISRIRYIGGFYTQTRNNFAGYVITVNYRYQGRIYIVKHLQSSMEESNMNTK